VAPDRAPDPIAVALSFVSLLERLGIRYVVGGSLASSVHGEPRSTNDVDVVADLQPAQVRALVDAMADEYYVSTDAASDAVATGGAFNAIHLASGVKVDVFVAGRDPFELDGLKHAVPVRLVTGESSFVLADTAENTILRKLEWYRRGGEVSERQWRDVVAILRLNCERLNRDQLVTWAERLGVSDLLARAVDDARSV
jgi:hypothetical protein